MEDFAVALGLVFAIEGLLLAAFPAMMRRSMLEAAARPDGWLRVAGLVAAVFGVAVVAAARYLL